MSTLNQINVNMNRIPTEKWKTKELLGTDNSNEKKYFQNKEFMLPTSKQTTSRLLKSLNTHTHPYFLWAACWVQSCFKAISSCAYCLLNTGAKLSREITLASECRMILGGERVSLVLRLKYM